MKVYLVLYYSYDWYEFTDVVFLSEIKDCNDKIIKLDDYCEEKILSTEDDHKESVDNGEPHYLIKEMEVLK